MNWFKTAGMPAKLSIIASILLILTVSVLGYMFISQTNDISPLKKNTTKAALEERVDSYINTLVSQKSFSGSILIAKKGEILLSKGYGMANYELSVPNTPKTKFIIASISKTYTAAAILQLAEKGKLSLGDTLDKYIPDYPNGAKIKVENLLGCTSGIPDYTDGPDLLEISKAYRSPLQLIDLFKNKPLEFEPGSKFKYSNSGYVVLGYIIEKVTGDTYEQYLKDNIFTPLEMKDSGVSDNVRLITNKASGYSAIRGDIQNCEYTDSSFHFGAGGIYSTVEDLYKWDRALYSGKILSKQSLEKMFTPSKDIFGYGWLSLDSDVGNVKKKLLKTSGLIFGYDCTIERYVDDDVVLIILSNFENFRDGSMLGEVCEKLVPRIFGLE